MPRVSDEFISHYLATYAGDSWEFQQYVSALKDLQDARAALQAIANWKDRTTDEAPLTYIERVAKEVWG